MVQQSTYNILYLQHTNPKITFWMVISKYKYVPRFSIKFSLRNKTVSVVMKLGLVICCPSLVLCGRKIVQSSRDVASLNEEDGEDKLFVDDAGREVRKFSLCVLENGSLCEIEDYDRKQKRGMVSILSRGLPSKQKKLTPISKIRAFDFSDIMIDGRLTPQLVDTYKTICYNYHTDWLRSQIFYAVAALILVKNLLFSHDLFIAYDRSISGGVFVIATGWYSHFWSNVLQGHRAVQGLDQRWDLSIYNEALWMMDMVKGMCAILCLVGLELIDYFTWYDAFEYYIGSNGLVAGSVLYIYFQTGIVTSLLANLIVKKPKLWFDTTREAGL